MELSELVLPVKVVVDDDDLHRLDMLLGQLLRTIEELEKHDDTLEILKAILRSTK